MSQSNLFLVLWMIFSFFSISSAALVESYQCPDISSSNFEFGAFTSEAYYYPDNTSLNFKLNTVALFNIEDVNTTTNKFTTMRVQIAFMGKNIIDDYLRFCDYAVLSSNSSYKGDTSNGSLSAPESTSTNEKRGFQVDNELVLPGNEIYKRDTNNCPFFPGDHLYLNYSVNVGKYHKLASYTAQFSIISNVDDPEVIGCTRTYITPVLPSYISNIIFSIVVCFLLLTAIINGFIVVCSSFQESRNPFLFIASTICNSPLLKQMDCTVRDILLYLQFALFIGGLGLQYPGYYQPLVSNIRWCALMIYSIAAGLKKITKEDNIYVTYNEGGLKTLALYTLDQSPVDTWKNFIVWLLIIMAISIVGQEILLGLAYVLWKKSSQRTNFDFKPLRNVCFLLGSSVNLFLRVFAAPFLILTFFLLSKTTQNHSAPSSLINSLYVSPEFNSTSPLSIEDENILAQYSYTIPPWVIAISCILLAIWILLYLFFCVKYVFGKGRKQLYSSLKAILIWGNLYHRYGPSKVPFVLFETIHLFFKSIVIGLLQSYGAVQVSLLIISEILYFIFFVFIQPNYVDLTWSSSEVLLGVARIIVTILCIPYIKSIEVNETTRTYVSYVQLFVHAIVGVIFFAKVIKSFISTLNSIVRSHFEKVRYMEQVNKEEANTALGDRSNNDFYYRSKSAKKLVEMREVSLLNNSNSAGNSTIDDMDEGGKGSDYLLRPSLVYQDPTIIKSQLQNADHPSSPLMTDFDTHYEGAICNTSNRRGVDYTVREADLFYDRFCENADPEVKNLWDSRNVPGNRFQFHQASTNMNYTSISQNSVGLTYKLKSFFGQVFHYKPVAQEDRGFQVARPKKLVIKKLGDSNNTKRNDISYPSSKIHSEDEFVFFDKVTNSDDSFNFNQTVAEDTYSYFAGDKSDERNRYTLIDPESAYMGSSHKHQNSGESGYDTVGDFSIEKSMY